MSTFDVMMAAVTNQRRIYLTRAHAMDATIPTTIDVIVTYGYGDPGDNGHSVYTENLGAPTPGGFTTAGGRKWSVVPVGDLRLEQFGGKALPTEPTVVNNVVVAPDNWQAFQDCVAAISIVTSAKTIHGPRIDAGYGWYYFSDTINLKGQGKHLATTFWFAKDKHGIIAHSDDTMGEGIIDPPTTTAGWSQFRDLAIECQGGGTVGHGFWARCGVTVENVFIEHMPQNGFNLIGTRSSDGSIADHLIGNVNSCELRGCESNNNGWNGFEIQGKDANTINTFCCSTIGNGRFGLDESSFLGGQHFGFKAAGNGFPSQVHRAGNRYYYKGGDGGGTTPGTNEAVWGFVEVGGMHSTVFAEWVPGKTYFEGGPWRVEGDSNVSAMIGPYTESGQPPARIDKRAVSIAGTQAGDIPVTGDGIQIGREMIRGVARFFPIPRTDGLSLTVSSGYASDETWRYTAPGVVDHPSGLSLTTWRDAEGCFVTMHGRSSSSIPVRYTTDATTLTGGRVAVIPAGNVLFGKGIWRGASTNSLRYETNGAAAPTTGEWARGDIVWNLSPSASATMGWMCVLGGTPGTWKAMPNLAA